MARMMKLSHQEFKTTDMLLNDRDMSEKWINRLFHHFENIMEYTYTNLDGLASCF